MWAWARWPHNPCLFGGPQCHGGDVSSLLYATPPPSRSGPKAPKRRGGQEGRLGGGGSRRPGGLAMPAMLIGLNKIPQISFMAAFATSLLSNLDPNTHSNPSLG